MQTNKLMDISKLLSYDGENFIEQVYKNILGRDPDPEGLRYYSCRLLRGESKKNVIYDIARSKNENIYYIDGLDRLIKKQSSLFNRIFRRKIKGCSMESTGVEVMESSDAFNQASDYIEHWRSLMATEENRVAGLFDSEWYASQYPDVINSGVDPFTHYILYGHKKLYNPGPLFDTDFYIREYPDIVSQGSVPLIHYLEFGRQEGRHPNPHALAEQKKRKNLRHVIVKELMFASSNEVVILVSHSSNGRLKPHVLSYMSMLVNCGLSVLLVAVVDRPIELSAEEISIASGIIVRDNAGYDFGAWSHALSIVPELYSSSMLILSNDSIIPTSNKESFLSMLRRVRSSPADVVGLTSSHEYGWHIQSYFIAIKPKALSSFGFQNFIRGIQLLDDKDEVIRSYEVPFTKQMQSYGLTVESVFKSPFSINPTLFGWRRLLKDGFPFVKVLLLRGEFNDVDISEWKEELELFNFDIDIIKETIAVAKLNLPDIDENDQLLINGKTSSMVTSDHKLRVALFGPWNYDNGLGSASRELICALRRLNIVLNLYPIEKPFHIHRQISPAVGTYDFGAVPDVAIVHLNPDSWHLLTDEQLSIISSAKRRIGYWVWETDTIPPAWAHNLYSVDRIWAPSTYCAKTFSEQIDLPVDIVPHPVAVPPHAYIDRGEILRRFGLGADSRVILYAFDGASYLVRKNPAALIRAFAASSLEKLGWTLLLKTKHLYDRHDAGAELSAMAASTAGVKLADTSLTSGEMSALMAAVDIYASPHASEGFGLTVAEAMAMGKPVVATDYSGTRDFLNVNCGYPVAWSPITLECDHGHYLSGHSWAKIDEQELASALLKAAAAVERGDDSIPRAARAHIAAKLSYDAVATAIYTSFVALTTTESKPKALVHPRPPQPSSQINLDIHEAKDFSTLVPVDGIVPISLSSDLVWNGNLPNGESNDWLFFAPGNAKIAPDAFDIVKSTSRDRPDVVLFYGDDIATYGDRIDRIRLKPEFDRSLLTAQDYIGAPVIVRRSTLLALGGLSSNYGSAVLFDLVLRVADAGFSLSRIPHILLAYTGELPRATLDDRRSALLSYKLPLASEIVDGRAPGLLSMKFRFTPDNAPEIGICIPTKRSKKSQGQELYIEALLTEIAKANWPMERLTVVVGDDIPNEPDWATQRWPFRLVRLETPRQQDEPFNYARKMNHLWKHTSGDIVVFMNDDVAPLDNHWLHALAGFASQGRIGGVGARLLYEDGSLQHAGIYPAFGTVVHAWLGLESSAHTYQNWALSQREWSMVTGAVFATRRELLEKINGFDESFSLEFNDIDLCLRIRNLGYSIVYNPDVEFTHIEKASRGDTIPPGQEVALFLDRWARWLEKDPSSHPLLAKNCLDLFPNLPDDTWCIWGRCGPSRELNVL